MKDALISKGIRYYAFILFVMFLLSMKIWIGWDGRGNIFMFLFSVLALFVSSLYKVPLSFTRKNILLCVLLYVVSIIIGRYYDFDIILKLFFATLLPFICVVCLRDNLKPVCLSLITKYYAILLCTSICFWLANMVVDMPAWGIIKFDNLGGYEDFDNYIFFVQERSVDGTGRFSGPFLEPGYVGMMGAFLLMSNLFELRNKYNIIILVSILLSFSLAGYMLTFVGYVLCQYYKGKLSLSFLLKSGAVIFLLLIFGIIYNGGDNMFNSLVLSRFQASDNETGFSGNNRTSLPIMLMFYEMWSDPSLLLFGYGPNALDGLEEYQKVGTGFQFFMVMHGLLQFLLIMLYYIIVCLTSKDKKIAFLFLLFVFISFLQRDYALWLSWIICFSYCVESSDYYIFQMKLK